MMWDEIRDAKKVLRLCACLQGFSTFFRGIPSVATACCANLRMSTS